MSRAIVWVGLDDLFYLKIIRKLQETVPFVLCICSQLAVDKIRVQILENAEFEEAKELMKCLDTLVFLQKDIGEICLADCEKLQFANELQLWFSDSIFFSLQGNLLENDINDDIWERIHSLCEGLPISDIHYITSTFLPTNAFAFYGNMIRRLRGTEHRSTVYEVPYYTYDYTNGAIVPMERFMERVQLFAEWVELRIAGYFQDMALHIFQKYEGQFDCISLNEAAKKIVDSAQKKRQKRNAVYFISGSQLIRMKDFAACMGEQLGITVEFVKKRSDLNEIDQILERILEKHVPIGKTAVPHRNDLPLDFAKKVPFLAKKKEKFFVPVYTKKEIQTPAGNPLSYYTIGQGEPLIIVNAFGARAAAWNRLIGILSRLFYVAVWDIPGVFEENGFGEIRGVEMQQQDIEAVIEQEGFERVHILTWCSGVKSSLLYVQKHESRVCSLTVLSGDFAPYPGFEPAHSRFFGNISFVEQLMQDNPKMFHMYLQMIWSGTFNKMGEQKREPAQANLWEIIPQKYRKIFLEHFQSPQKSCRFFKLCMEYYQHDISVELKQLKFPVLLISAENDHVASAEQTKWAHCQIPYSWIYELPGATHLIMLERTADVVNCLLQNIRYTKLLLPMLKGSGK